MYSLHYVPQGIVGHSMQAYTYILLRSFAHQSAHAEASGCALFLEHL